MSRYKEALAALALAASSQAASVEAAEQREHLATQQRLIESLNALASRRQASRPGVPA